MLKLNSLFSDGAVLQRRQSLTLFGKADPYSVVEAEFCGETFCGGCGIDGSFLIRMHAFEAGGPYELRVRSRISGDEIVVHNLLVGEVWLAGGQSNMQFWLSRAPEQEREFQEKGYAADEVRMFTVPRRPSCAPENDTEGVWRSSADAEAVKLFSAVGLWYAVKMHRELHVPVGIISCSYGGSVAQAWTSRSTLMRNEELRGFVLEYENVLSRPSRWAETDLRKEAPFCMSSAYLAEHFGPHPENTGFENGWHKNDFPDETWLDFELPGSWVSRHIARSGTVWVRKKIDIPAEWAGRDLVLHLGGIDKQDITWFNGEEIGRTGQGYEYCFWNTPRVYRVPGRLVCAGTNVLAIRAYSFAGDGSFNGAADGYYVTPAEGGARISLAGAAKLQVEYEVPQAVRMPDQNCSASCSGPWYFNSPYILFDAMVRPLIPYAMRGVIWYQGENNTSMKGCSYKRLLRDLIADWRHCWGQGDFPFVLVQLANFRAPQCYEETSDFAVVRQAQLEVSREVPECGLAVAIDLGCADDVHPHNKRDVGFRLADWALRNVYGLAHTRECSPVPRCIRHEGNALRVLFDNATSGLVLRAAPDNGFRLAGENERGGEEPLVYHPAEAEVDGASVILRAAGVPNPLHVRYLWADNPACVTLYNGEGLPASPFEF